MNEMRLWAFCKFVLIEYKGTATLLKFPALT
jgi:hypothetical protein